MLVSLCLGLRTNSLSAARFHVGESCSRGNQLAAASEYEVISHCSVLSDQSVCGGEPPLIPDMPQNTSVAWQSRRILTPLTTLRGRTKDGSVEGGNGRTLRTHWAYASKETNTRGRPQTVHDEVDPAPKKVSKESSLMPQAGIRGGGVHERYAQGVNHRQVFHLLG